MQRSTCPGFGLLLCLLCIFPLLLRGDDISIFGHRALATPPQQWQQVETEHLIIHCANEQVGKAVGIEAEFYFRHIVAELDLSPDSREPRSHLFVFESEECWGNFARLHQLEQWTGAFTMGNEIFIPRYPEQKHRDNILAHEMVHLMVNRYLGKRLPRWLAEGYAEEVSVRGNVSFLRSRGYRARALTPYVAKPFPLEELFSAESYPEGDRVFDFYRQSLQLVSFLIDKGGKADFARFFKLMSDGEGIDRALQRTYFGRWSTVPVLEKAFMEQIAIGPPPRSTPRAERDE